jgi:hypothetical protein
VKRTDKEEGERRTEKGFVESGVPPDNQKSEEEFTIQKRRKIILESPTE